MTTAEFVQQYGLMIICLVVAAPFASGIAVYVYMRFRWARGIRWQRDMDRNLFKGL